MLHFQLLRGPNKFVRSLHYSLCLCKAKPFLMPAMSPTMEKGNIVEWKFKVGESFNAGDVLLEVETDKAQIDVEAQDDGKLAKIIMENGTKNVNIGQQIAVIADIEDDLSTLNFSNMGLIEKPEVVLKGKIDKQPQKINSVIPSSEILSPANNSQFLLPSVKSLLHDNHIDLKDALTNIKASGPNGRILKGDVMAYLGKISYNSLIKITEYIKKHESLDLTNTDVKTLHITTPTPVIEKLPVSKKPIKPTSIILKEEFIFKAPSTISFKTLSTSLHNFITTSKLLAHEHPISKQSKYVDPIFEELLTQEPRKSRFNIEYTFTPLNDQTYNTNTHNIFDLISNSLKSKPSNDQPSFQEYSLTVRIVINNTFTDATFKANKFINYLKELEFFNNE